MNLYRVLQGYKTASLQASVPRVITLGSFDGLHLGHQKVISEVISISEKTSLVPGLLTFYPHPSIRLKRANIIPKITSLRQRISLLSKFGIQELFLLNFNSALSKMEWQQFCDEILIKRLNTKCLVIGSDARIGKGALGTAITVPPYLEARGVKVVLCQLDNDTSGIKYSSRNIREYISKGDLDKTSASLGRKFQIAGTVVSGNKLGSKFGFPTANIYSSRMITPAIGVYAVNVMLDNDPQIFSGVMNVGFKPTLEKSISSMSKPTVEVFIFDFNKQIYRQKITVDIVARIRNEIKFESIDNLKIQIQKDCQAAKQILDSQIS